MSNNVCTKNPLNCGPHESPDPKSSDCFDCLLSKVKEQNNCLRIEAGSVSHATMRNQDLLPAFIDTLENYDSQKLKELTSNLVIPDNDLDPYWDTEECSELLWDLHDALNLVCPEGMYFGSHPGDGSDYGFWFCEIYAD